MLRASIGAGGTERPGFGSLVLGARAWSYFHFFGTLTHWFRFTGSCLLMETAGPGWVGIRKALEQERSKVPSSLINIHSP